jgi:hypothetical protein
MKKGYVIIKVLSIWVMAPMIMADAGQANAGELGHYMPGVANIRDFVVPPEPGYYLALYNLLYTTDTYKNRNGDTVDTISIGPAVFDVDANIDAYAIQPTFIWGSPKELLGASYAAYIGIPLVNTSIQASLSNTTRFGIDIDPWQWNLGDIYFKPIWLGWNSAHYGITAGYGVYAPTGSYDDEDESNTSLGFWTHEFQAGVTWYPWEHQGTAVMINGIYEIHTEKEDADITPGDRFSLDYGISQYLPMNAAQTLFLEMGVSGYSQWQVSEDSGADVRQALVVKDQIHGIGGQIGLASIPLNGSLTFRYLKEYSAEARFEGNLVTLTFIKGF